MKTVGVRELRQQASRYLREVERGSAIEITDRGRPVARLVPIPHSSPVDALLATGEISPAAGDPLEPPLAYAESLTGAMYLNKPDEVAAYRLAWDDIEKRALDERSSSEVITKAQKGYAHA